MSGAATQPAPSFSDRFAWAIELLFRGLRTSSPKHGPGGHLGALAWNRLQRLLARFVALAAAIEAGRVPVLRPRGSRPMASARAAFAPASAPTPAPAPSLPGTSSVVYVPPWRQGPGAEDETKPFVPTARQTGLLGSALPGGPKAIPARLSVQCRPEPFRYRN